MATPDEEPTNAPPPADADEDASSVDRKILEMLVCPVTRTMLQFNRETNELISRAAGLAFPIRSGVPMMTTEAARELTDADEKPSRR